MSRECIKVITPGNRVEVVLNNEIFLKAPALSWMTRLGMISGKGIV